MILPLRFIWLTVFVLHAETNTTVTHTETIKPVKHESNATAKRNSTVRDKIAKQIEKEKKYAKEQKFYQADEYDFKGAEVDPETLEKIKPIEPDYDFDMSDVYRDDI